MQFTPDFYLQVHEKLYKRFLQEWGDDEPHGSEPADWGLKTIVKGEKNRPAYEEHVIRILFKVNYKYFYNLKLQAEGNKIIKWETDFAKTIFGYLGCEGRGINYLKQDFYKRHNTPQSVIEAQQKLDKRNEDKMTLSKRTSIESKPKNALKGIGAKCRSYLLDDKWWLYFYGYELPTSNDYMNYDWKLLSLVLSFQETNTDLKVFVKNKDDKDHYDYEGSTDFDYSSDTVLVMRLFTKPDEKRCLMIYVNIGKGEGNLFMGQYLNYDEYGYIFSGSVILERIDKTLDPNPQPYAFSVSRDAKQAGDYPVEVKHIASVLQERKLNFRRSPNTVHSRNDLIRWQKRRGGNKSD